ncbi:hypothetical protein NDU88_006756 [Pleurodeles waltl]|uniref:Uncharacterized protein n=1 Tax=Pleurodeles waltl TaxID=8319 RepID=A0AAV7UNP9_PLEWA|nr:hypothetical protein NDU88_006756 [Pleurodeles waltl]
MCPPPTNPHTKWLPENVETTWCRNRRSSCCSASENPIKGACNGGAQRGRILIKRENNNKKEKLICWKIRSEEAGLSDWSMQPSTAICPEAAHKSTSVLHPSTRRAIAVYKYIFPCIHSIKNREITLEGRSGLEEAA